MENSVISVTRLYTYDGDILYLKIKFCNRLQNYFVIFIQIELEMEYRANGQSFLLEILMFIFKLL